MDEFKKAIDDLHQRARELMNREEQLIAEFRRQCAKDCDELLAKQQEPESR